MTSPAPAWETSKENVAPLARGRNTGVLTTALGSSKADTERSRVAHEEAVREAMAGSGPHAEDALAAWVSYVKWILGAYPPGDELLVGVVEGACRRFVGEERYRNDIRFVRLWVRYADLRKDALDVFSYMKTKGIGELSALFYEAWATTLEFKKQFDKADQVYLLGIEKDAQPATRLIQRQREYYARMAARVRRDEAKARDTASKSKGKRKTPLSTPLAQASPALSASSRRMNRAPSDENAAPAAGERVRPALGHLSERQAQTGRRPLAEPAIASTSSRLTAVDGPAIASRSGERFQIFADPLSTVDPTPAQAVRNEGGGETLDFPFSSLAKTLEVRKENAGSQPSKWAGETLPQSESAALRTLVRRPGQSTAAAPFEIYRDDEDQQGTREHENMEHVHSRTPAQSAEESQRSSDHRSDPSSSHATNERRADSVMQERPSSPVPSRKSTGSMGAVSPTINTKIAMQQVDDMFNSPLPMERAREQHELMRSGRSASSRTPAPVPVVRPSAPAFEIYNDFAEDDDKENAEVAHQASGISGLSGDAVLEARVLQPVPELEGGGPRGNEYVSVEYDQVFGAHSDSISCATPAQADGDSSDNFMEILVTWCVGEENYHLIVDSPNVEVDDMLTLQPEMGEARSFCVGSLCDTGYRGQSQVFVAEALDTLVEAHSDDEDAPSVAIKVSPNNVWEFYVYKTLHARLGRPFNSVPQALGLYHGDPTSYLVLGAVSEASLADALGVVPPAQMTESVVLFFAVKMLETLEAVHESGVIHSDFTLDNVLIRDEGAALGQNEYSPDGDNGWSRKGILVVDFNSAVDTRHSTVQGDTPEAIVAHASRLGNKHLKEEYRIPGAEKWAFNADCFAVSVCVARLLGLEGFDCASSEKSIKHVRMWESFFDTMHTLTPYSRAVDTIRAMQLCRKDMEETLCEDTTLKVALRRVFIAVLEAKANSDVTRG